MHTVAEYNSEIAWCTVFSIKMALQLVYIVFWTMRKHVYADPLSCPLLVHSCKGRVVMTKSPGVRCKPAIINIGWIVLLSPPKFWQIFIPELTLINLCI